MFGLVKDFFVGLFLLTLALSCTTRSQDAELGERKPNVVIILADDLGYNDLGCYGSKLNKTPVLDRLAREGGRFTDFYSSSNVCSPSRASLLTGRYPQRCGVPFATALVYSDLGLQADEITLAEILKGKGYKTAAIGKWHLGQPQGMNFSTHEGFSASSEFHPQQQGFDLFYGAVANAIDGETGKIPLIENEQLLIPEMTVDTVTEYYTKRAVQFIKENKSRPFFLYLSHTRVHYPLLPNPKFEGNSGNGPYGDMVEELDWSTGEVIQALEAAGVADNTLVIFTSDNGAVLVPDLKAGLNLPFRGGKFTTWEGGHKVPAIFRWPDKIPPHEINYMATLMDIFPTVAHIVGADTPADRKIDGRNIADLLLNAEHGKSLPQQFYYYNGFNLQAVRRGHWKLHLPRTEEMLVWWDHLWWKHPEELSLFRKPLLFDLDSDPAETTDLAHKHPQVVDQLLALAEKVRAELGSWEQEGSEQKDIKEYLDDRSGLRLVRTQQNHENMGQVKIDPSVDKALMARLQKQWKERYKEFRSSNE